MSSQFLKALAIAKGKGDCGTLSTMSAEWKAKRGAKLTGKFVQAYGAHDPLFATVCSKKGSGYVATSATPPPVASTPAPSSPPAPATDPSTWAGPDGVTCRRFNETELGDFESPAGSSLESYENRRKACACKQQGMKGRCSTEGLPWGAYDGAPPPPITTPPPPYDVPAAITEDPAVNPDASGSGWMLDPDTGQVVKQKAAVGGIPSWVWLALAGVVVLGGGGAALRARRRRKAAA